MTTHNPVALQWLNILLLSVWETNVFYREKWQAAGVSARQLERISDLRVLPLTTRAEIVESQRLAPPFGTNCTFSLSNFFYSHDSSGSTGNAIHWPDDTAGWQWILRGSQTLYEFSGVTANDRIFMAHFDPKLMSSASLLEGAKQFASNTVSARQESEYDRIKCLRDFRPTVVVGKARELILLGEAALRCGIDPATVGVCKLIAGGSGPATSSIREWLQRQWNAQVFDRYGMTEAGPISGECQAHAGMHIRPDSLIAEVIDPETGKSLPDGASGELVLTTLGRIGSPAIRYHTGDRVQLVRKHHCPCGCPEPLLVGGVLRGENQAST